VRWSSPPVIQPWALLAHMFSSTVRSAQIMVSTEINRSRIKARNKKKKNEKKNGN
jgi:hypothetical protein